MLGLPSGYSWGAALLVLLGIAAWPQTLRQRQTWPPELRRWGWAVLGMGLVWLMHSWANGQWVMHTLGLDRSVKYALLLLALPALLPGLPRVDALRWGCWVGALAAGLIAAREWLWLGLERVSGYTNAIQFGNLALLLALWSWIWARHTSCRRQKVLGYSAAVAGAFACLASGSRGGWLVAPLLLVLVWVLDAPERNLSLRQRLPLLLKTATAGLLLCAAFAALPPVQQRIAKATEEWQAWQQHGESNNSVGQRLAHWQVAWNIALEKPWLGWGQVDYDARKQALIQAGQAPSSVADFNHAHHEWIDMFAKRGLLGVLGLAAFFAVPGWCYVQTLRRAPRDQPAAPAELAALCGLVLVLGFVGFGLTQVMFAHNNAHMVFLFMNLLWLGVIVRSATTPTALAVSSHT